MNYFTTEPMHHIIDTLQTAVDNLGVHEKLSCVVLNPDCATSTYAGSIITYNGTRYIYRGYKAWVDLAQLLRCRMLTPILNHDHTVTLHFQKLDIDDSFHHLDVTTPTEKYGTQSHFSKINKHEEPAFVAAYLKALQAVHISQRTNVLNLGINNADEFALIQNTCNTFESISFTGIDYCDSAITAAQKRFQNSPNVTLFRHDINELHTLNLGSFDLIVSIGTLQSSGLHFKPLFMSLIQQYLRADGAVILGFPNCRWSDGEMLYGAQAPNYRYSELSLVIKDIYFCKKYLQQHRFRVTLTGKEYLFLTATRISTSS